MKKRFIGMFMAFAVLLSLVPTMAFAENNQNSISGSCGKNITWSIDEQGHMNITGTGEMGDFYTLSDWNTGEIIEQNPCPWEDYMEDITSVTIGEGITTVGECAFSGAVNLKSVTLPKTLKSIKCDAFSECTSLKEIVIPDACVEIGTGAFHRCLSMEKLVIGNGLKEIGAAVFDWLDSLKAFEVSANNATYKSVNGVLLSKDGKTLLAYPGGRACDSYTIPSTVKIIEEGAFSTVMNGPREIIIPTSVTTIRDSAFQYMESLESITIPKSVTDLGDMYTLFGCPNLKAITVQASVTTIPYGFAAECTSLESVVLPNGVTSIDEGAFNSCQKLSKITVPQNLKSIGRTAFYRCQSLVSFPFPKSLAYIGDHAFLESGITEMPSWLEHMDDDSYMKLNHMEFAVTHNQTKARNMLSMINKMRTDGSAWIRTESGGKKNLGVLNALKYDYNLERIAIQRANEIAVYFSHTRPNGGSCFDAVYNGTYSYGENICAGSGTTEGAFNIWCETDQPYSGQGHRRSMLSSSWTAIGIASVTVHGITYWVQEFSSKNSGAAKTTANDTKETVSVGFTEDAVDSAEIVLSKTSMTVNRGSSAALPTATVKVMLTEGWGADYEKCTSKATWKSSDSSIAKITDGKVSALKCGSATLTASALGATAKVSVTVPHTWDTGKIVKEATDTTTGSMTYTCTACGATKTETIAKLKVPGLPTLTNTASGINVKWTEVTGAAQYRVYYKTDSGSWTRAGDTKGTSFTMPASKLASGTKYSFTIRCLSADGKRFTSGFNAAGKAITYIAQPEVSSLTNTASGIAVKWGAVKGAAQYRVYYKPAGGSWTKVGDTTGTSFAIPDSKLTSGTKYSFTIRCLSADSKSFTSSYNATGKSITYVATPTISAVSNDAKGVTVKWNAVKGAEQYRVYYKTGSGSWTKFGDTTATNLTATGLSSGTKYSFTVRCLSADGKSFTSSFDATGKAITYIAQPEVSSLANTATGITVKWGSVKGAAQYRVYYKPAGGSWTKVGDTMGTSFAIPDSKLTSGTSYSFTIRCLSADSKSFTSSYNAVGKSITYIAQPAVNSLTNTANGVTVKWGTVEGAAQYRVYYKPAGGSWTKFGDTTTTSLTVTGLTSGAKYSFTVRCLSADGKSFTSSFDSAGKSIQFLSVPVLSDATVSGTGITVKWSKVTGATGYYVYRKTVASAWSKIGTVPSGGTVSFKDTKADKGTEYIYTVRAYAGSTMGSYSAAGVSAKR